MKARGLTLVEILVVVSIIAVLVALIFPIVASAKRGASEARCMSNLKQLHAAIEIYRNEWGGGGYGNPASMGMPPNLLRVEKEQGLPSAIHQCREGALPGQSFGVYVYFAMYLSDPNANKDWIEQTQRYGEDAILIADGNHNPNPMRMSPYFPVFGIGVRLNGSAERKRGMGSPRDTGFWH
jgi:prepilin-type N-terminal cleavage/methylation domain-containing protein